MKYEIKETKPSQKKIEAEITAEEFDNFYGEALKNLVAEAELPGFRKGKAPIEMVEGKVNPAALLSEASELAIRDTWLKILKESQLEAIAPPRVEILKVAKGNPFVFSLEVEVLPTVVLPNIREISEQLVKSAEKIEVSVQEIDDTIEWLRQSRAKLTDKDSGLEKGDMAEIHFEFLGDKEGFPKGEQHDSFVLGKDYYIQGMEQALMGMKKEEEKTFEAIVPMGQGGEKQEKVEVKVLVHGVKKVELPEINDAWVKSLGKFEALADLKQDIKKGITEEKEMAEQEKKRALVLEKICEKTKLEVPQSLIARETQALLNNLKNRVSAEVGIPFSKYLEQIKKTEEDINKEYEKIGEERVRAYLVLSQIEKDEKIEASEQEINNKIEKIISQYPDKEKARQEIGTSEAKAYLADEIKREKIFNLLGC